MFKPFNNLNDCMYSVYFREESPFPAKHGHVASKVGVPHVVPHGPAATGETITKEIHQRMSGESWISILAL